MNLLSDHLKNLGVYVDVSKDDSDGDIVRRAELVKEKKPDSTVIVIGEDVDLFLLIIALTACDREFYFSNKTHVGYSSQIH